MASLLILPQDMADSGQIVVMIAVAFALLLVGAAVLLVSRYRRCPSNKILVIYGRVQSGQSARCMHGGGAFVWPLVQHYDYLSLDPLQIEIPLRGALSAENIRVNVPSVFTVAIGTDAITMNNAAVRLLGLSSKDIVKQAEDIIFGQLRQVIASMNIEDINRDRDKFLASIHESIAPELEKIGMVLINVNITDITDESGYIEAIGRKAASEAVQQAEIDVAEQQKRGAIGVAEAEREKAVQVAGAERFREIGVKEAERDRAVRVAELTKEKQIGERTAEFERESAITESERQMRISVAEANAEAVAGENISKARVAETNAKLRVKEAEANAGAVSGENISKAKVADANADLRVKEATAYQEAETAKREAEAAVLKAQYEAESIAAEALARKVEQEKRAELEAVAKAQKAKTVVDAEADAEQRRIAARAEADAIFAKLDAEARGAYEILAKKGEGLKEIVAGCGGAQEAFQLLMLEQLEKLSENAARAISNIKFDKVVVWDGGASGKDGKSGTANFLHGLAGSLPPMLQMMKDVGGVQMPEFLGKLVGEESGKVDEAAPAAASANGEPPQAPAPTVVAKVDPGAPSDGGEPGSGEASPPRARGKSAPKKRGGSGGSDRSS